MRALCAAALALAALAAAPARAQVYVTSVTAAIPDSAGKVPGFNKVPGSAIPNWSNGLAQVVLTHGQSYNYCVSLGSAFARGTAGVSFAITQRKATVQSGVIVAPGGLTVGSDGVWYLCSGYTQLPSSPGMATLTGVVVYTPTGSTKTYTSEVSTHLILK